MSDPDLFTAAAPPGPGKATLQATATLDSDHPSVQAFAHGHARGSDDRQRAVALYLAVRDGFRYDPYRIDLTPTGMRASQVVEQGYGWCVTKATLLAAACRAVGIPARLGFADVRNHLSTERLRQSMKTDVFAWHGYTDIWLEGGWRKATPAFNLSLCEKFGLLPLEFDGRSDSIYHPYDRSGQRHMEYLHQRGSFDDLPLQDIITTFGELYPHWMPPGPTSGPSAPSLAQADFLADADREAPAG